MCISFSLKSTINTLFNIKYEENATSEHGEEAFEEYIERILNNIPYEEAFWGLTYLEGWDDYSDIDISDLMSDSEVFDDYDFGEEDIYEDKMYDSDDDYDEFY